jgi:hypothetical protein
MLTAQLLHNNIYLRVSEFFPPLMLSNIFLIKNKN